MFYVYMRQITIHQITFTIYFRISLNVCWKQLCNCYGFGFYQLSTAKSKYYFIFTATIIAIVIILRATATLAATSITINGNLFLILLCHRYFIGSHRQSAFIHRWPIWSNLKKFNSSAKRAKSFHKTPFLLQLYGLKTNQKIII